MRRSIKISLSLLLIALMAFCAFDAQAKTKKQPRTVYYIVCGSYSSLDKAIKYSEEMSEVMFYEVFKTTVKGKTVYRVCCDCYYSKDDAQKDLDGFYSGFKGSDWWIWPSKGLAKCVYRPYSPKGDNERIPEFRPHAVAITD